MERSTAESCNQQCQTHQVCLVIRKGQRKHGAGIVDHLDDRVRVIEISPRLFTRIQLGRAISDFQPDVIHCHLRRSTRLIAKLAPKAATVSTLHIEVNGPHFLEMDGLICNARWQTEAIPDSYVAGLTASGTPTEVMDKVEQYRAAGVELPLLRPAAATTLGLPATVRAGIELTQPDGATVHLRGRIRGATRLEVEFARPWPAGRGPARPNS